MNCFIESILILSKDGEKRTISLKPGLNIITGNSKTGKSALIEIVDYCLCSRTSNIPLGKISQFGYLYIVILNISNKRLVIARKKASEEKNPRLFVIAELKDVSDEISLEYFDQKESILLKDGQEQIERHLNMSVTNIAESNDLDDRKKRKASMREMTSFLFQHQNLLANKHAIFYRFDDYYKRQATIDSFPVFAGWVNDSYFALKRELENLEKDLRRLEIDKKKQSQAIQEVEEEIKGYFSDYYHLIGETLNKKLNLRGLIGLRKNLPDYSSKTFLSQDLLDEYNLLKKEREERNSQLLDATKQYKDLEETENYANEFQISLKTLELKSTNATEEKIYNCPTCGKINDNLTQEMIRLEDARKNLRNELQQLSSYTVSYQKEKDSIQSKQNELKRSIINLNNRIQEIEEINKQISEENNISKNVLYAKAKINLRIDLLEKESNAKVIEGEDELRLNIDSLRNRLSKFSLDSLYNQAEAFLSKNMNKIGSKLDFEEELKPLNFKFDLRTFTFIHEDDNVGTISLNEMGSGANWLTCHLSIFLSLLHFFAIQKNSVIPSFLFLDQPSQVYFPRNFREGESEQLDHDISQVEKIYKAILEELDEIKRESNHYPQVIVTDHADNLNLTPYNFSDYVRKRWTPDDAKALI